MNICELLENNTQQQQQKIDYDESESEKMIKEKLTITDDDNDDGGDDESSQSRLSDVESAAGNIAPKTEPLTPSPATNFLPNVEADHLHYSGQTGPSSHDEEEGATSQSEFNNYLMDQLKNEPNDNVNSTTNQEEHESQDDHSPYFSNSTSGDEETDFNSKFAPWGSKN